MATQSRWERAQEYEASYWMKDGKAEEMQTSAPAWYGWRAEQLALRLNDAGFDRLTGGDARVLEVGSGPIGLVRYFPGKVRMAVDPLDRTYASNPGLVSHRIPEIQYREGRGEALPCETGSFDLVIIENCIDHVRDMDLVMRELTRVLAPGGVLYLTVNCRSPFGYYMHRLISRLRIDPGHPHTFTPERLTAMLGRHDYAVRTLWPLGTYEKARAEDASSPERKARIKAMLHVSEFAVAVLAQQSRRGPT
jgi:SAM-dependent methyltransferase